MRHHLKEAVHAFNTGAPGAGTVAKYRAVA
jgi:hypothetical protein